MKSSLTPSCTPSARLCLYVLFALFALAGVAWTQVQLVQISSDPYTNTNTFHATEVEPDTFAFGNTIVATFQVGRGPAGGASDTGWATSTDGGRTWTHGFLPGITKADNPANPYDLANDPGVGYDAKHGVWLIITMPWDYATQAGSHGGEDGKPPRPPVPIPAAIISRSSDGINWEDPISIGPNVKDSDKPWVVCDNTPTSPFYGHCYAEWDVPTSSGRIQMSTSTDGGLTWGPVLSTGDQADGVGPQPLVQPNGTVIAPTLTFIQDQMLAYQSTDGGNSWSSTVLISPVTQHHAGGNFRTSAMPSAEMDRQGRVYNVWQDCRFRTNCTSNDLVMSTSIDGINWTTVRRIPLDPVTSTVDHFIPGLAVDRKTSGQTAHLALTYYYFPQADCTADTCQLYCAFSESRDGGNTWSRPITLAGPMTLSWMPIKSGRPMVADYISTSWVNGKAFAALIVAQPKNGSTLNVATYTTARGMSAPKDGPWYSSDGDKPVFNPTSDYYPTGQGDDDDAEDISDMFTVLPDLDFRTLGDFGVQADEPEGLEAN